MSHWFNYVFRKKRLSTALLIWSIGVARVYFVSLQIIKSGSQITFVFESRNREIIATHMEHGKINEAKFQECLGTAEKASSNMFESYREVVKKKFSKIQIHFITRHNPTRIYCKCF